MKIYAFIILFFLLFSSCNSSIGTTDKAITCSSTICDNSLYIYFVSNKNIYTINKNDLEFSTYVNKKIKTLFIKNNQLYFNDYDNIIYKYIKKNKYEEIFEYNNAVGIHFIVTDDKIYYDNTYVSGIIEYNVHDKTYSIENSSFPLLSEDGSKLYTIKRSFSTLNEYVTHTLCNDVETITTYQRLGTMDVFNYNNEFFIYKNEFYHLLSGYISKTDITSGKTIEKLLQADSIVAVAHNKIYYMYKKNLYEYNIVNDTISKYPVNKMSEDQILYVDSYTDVVYHIIPNDYYVEIIYPEYNIQ